MQKAQVQDGKDTYDARGAISELDKRSNDDHARILSLQAELDKVKTDAKEERDRNAERQDAIEARMKEQESMAGAAREQQKRMAAFLSQLETQREQAEMRASERERDNDLLAERVRELCRTGRGGGGNEQPDPMNEEFGECSQFDQSGEGTEEEEKVPNGKKAQVVFFDTRLGQLKTAQLDQCEHELTKSEIVGAVLELANLLDHLEEMQGVIRRSTDKDIQETRSMADHNQAQALQDEQKRNDQNVAAAKRITKLQKEVDKLDKQGQGLRQKMAETKDMLDRASGDSSAGGRAAAERIDKLLATVKDAEDSLRWQRVEAVREGQKLEQKRREGREAREGRGSDSRPLRQAPPRQGPGGDERKKVVRVEGGYGANPRARAINTVQRVLGRTVGVMVVGMFGAPGRESAVLQFDSVTDAQEYHNRAQAEGVTVRRDRSFEERRSIQGRDMRGMRQWGQGARGQQSWLGAPGWQGRHELGRQPMRLPWWQYQQGGASSGGMARGVAPRAWQWPGQYDDRVNSPSQRPRVVAGQRGPGGGGWHY